MSKPFKIDMSYAGDDGTINGYKQADFEKKEKFLRDGKTLLRRVGTAFEREGWTKKIVANRAGPAVSGEVFMYLFHGNLKLGLFIEVGTALLRVGSMGGFGRHSDGAMIMVQYRTNDGRNSIVGNNIYLSAGLNDVELVGKLSEITSKIEKKS